MRTIIMSIRARHIRSILAGRKVWELRTTRPAQDPPFQVLLCQTGTCGRITAAFECSVVTEVTGLNDAEIARRACVTPEEVAGYRRDGRLYAWVIRGAHRLDAHTTDYGVDRPPRSWRYVRQKSAAGA